MNTVDILGQNMTHNISTLTIKMILFASKSCHRFSRTIRETSEPVSYTHLDVYKRQVDEDKSCSGGGVHNSQGFSKTDTEMGRSIREITTGGAGESKGKIFYNYSSIWTKRG